LREIKLETSHKSDEVTTRGFMRNCKTTTS